MHRINPSRLFFNFGVYGATVYALLGSQRVFADERIPDSYETVYLNDSRPSLRELSSKQLAAVDYPGSRTVEQTARALRVLGIDDKIEVYFLARVNRKNPFYKKYQIPRDPSAFFFSAVTGHTGRPFLVCGFLFRGSLKEVFSLIEKPEFFAVKLDPVDRLDTLPISLKHLERYFAVFGKLPPEGSDLHRNALEFIIGAFDELSEKSKVETHSRGAPTILVAFTKDFCA